MSGTVDREDWRAYHLFYHGDRDRLLGELVAPWTARWSRAGWIEGWFFVRFSLGGPHIRLRVRPRRQDPEIVAAIDREVHAGAAEFFARVPSLGSLDAEAIRRGNQPLLANDPFETDDAVHPDNSVQSLPCRLDVGRYGGEALLAPSLALFEASSRAALELLAGGAAGSQASRLSAAGRALLVQALGTAGSEAELLELLDYGVTHWGEPLARMVTEADGAFARRPEALRGLVRGALAGQGAAGSGGSAVLCAVAAAARRLAACLCDADLATRKRIGWSQLHMTANRFGLANPHEVYLSRQLGRAARSLAECEPEAWRGALAAMAPAAMATMDAASPSRTLREMR